MTDHHITRRTQVQEALRQKTRSVPDFPASGVVFEDLTPVLADAEALRLLVDDLAAAGHTVASLTALLAVGTPPPPRAGALPPAATTMGAELISGLDARGFLLASAVAYKLELGLLAIRKKGKLPPPVITKEYALEYGSAALELPRNGLDLTGKKIVLIDDVLATGGTLLAARDLITDMGGIVAGYAVVLEVAGLNGRDRLPDAPLYVVNEP